MSSKTRAIARLAIALAVAGVVNYAYIKHVIVAEGEGPGALLLGVFSVVAAIICIPLFEELKRTLWSKRFTRSKTHVTK